MIRGVQQIKKRNLFPFSEENQAASRLESDCKWEFSSRNCIPEAEYYSVRNIVAVSL